jgi:hypothetical protein
MKTTNYFNTFIEVADDCRAEIGEIPKLKKDEKTVANLQFEIITENPYKYTSDDVVFAVFSQKSKIPAEDLVVEREEFFSKGQPCLRCSPLTKRYGWGVHSNEEGKVAIYPVNSEDYEKYKNDKRLQHVKGMRSKRENS